MIGPYFINQATNGITVKATFDSESQTLKLELSKTDPAIPLEWEPVVASDTED